MTTDTFTHTHTHTHTHTLTGLHLDRRRSALNVHLFESSLNFLQLQQDLFYVPSWEAWRVSFLGFCWLRTMGSLTAPVGMCPCWKLTWGGLRTSGWLFCSFLYFLLKSENNKEIYAQACKCDWTCCNTLKMQTGVSSSRRMMINVCEQKQHLAFKKKYSIRIARHFNV